MWLKVSSAGKKHTRIVEVDFWQAVIGHFLPLYYVGYALYLCPLGGQKTYPGSSEYVKKKRRTPHPPANPPS